MFWAYKIEDLIEAFVANIVVHIRLEGNLTKYLSFVVAPIQRLQIFFFGVNFVLKWLS